jgi:hypothetical protein
MEKTNNYYGTYMRGLQETQKKTSGYYGNYMRVLQEMLETQRKPWTHMRVLQRMTNVNNYGWPICGYCKRCQKYQRLLWDLDAGIALNVICLWLF